MELCHALAHAISDVFYVVVAGTMTIAFLVRGRKISQLEQEREHLEAALDACAAELIRLARRRDVQ